MDWRIESSFIILDTSSENIGAVEISVVRLGWTTDWETFSYLAEIIFPHKTQTNFASPPLFHEPSSHGFLLFRANHDDFDGFVQTLVMYVSELENILHCVQIFRIREMIGQVTCRFQWIIGVILHNDNFQLEWSSFDPPMMK